ncbi:MAG TPA: DUF4239 domain-containing protein [Bryobacteraceae bacterium]|jgi:hypothetical protein|nr:DUF4239 domain-containing protein [Bryobacteraceae bacterium]
MLNALESSLIVLASMLSATACLFAYRRYWLRNNRHQLNDIIGWQISFLATTYAVIVAFMLADVWNNYRAAQANSESEANALINLYRSSGALSRPQNGEIRSLAKQYATAMVNEEWPAMQIGSFSRAGFTIVHQLWTTLTRTEVHSASEQAILSRALSDLTNLTEHRRIRHLDSRSGMPAIFWVLLIAGGVLTVLYTCFFDIEDSKVHAAQVLGTTFMIALVLVTIADVDAPYGGAIRIQPTAFQQALQTMADEAVPLKGNAGQPGG